MITDGVGKSPLIFLKHLPRYKDRSQGHTYKTFDDLLDLLTN